MLSLEKNISDFKDRKVVEFRGGHKMMGLSFWWR